ncbi:MAG: universal stress protein, partial [Muribaculaceae bacterium]|nr:universal stress protein [Muribaculaceae bacterium]
MTPNRLITIAIHTVEKALPLKNLLEREGIYVELNNVNLASPTVAAGVRIRIKESDLPLALRIIENIEIFNIPATGEEGEAGGVVLLPTDFSPHSDNAAKVAFRLASRLGFSIEMLHSFIAPASPRGVQLMDSYDYELADMVERQTIEEEAKLMMENYTARVRSWIKS